MSLSDRNIITPQMYDYDRIGDEWVPYLMRFDKPNRIFNSVSTNKWGFRNTIGLDGIVDEQYIASIPKDKKIGVIVGSSAVFGVGATSDKFTIASELNRNTETVWLNYGGRAFNSTQELQLFILHLPKRVDEVIILSGVNNLTLAFLSETTSRVYNSFFFQSTFVNTMKNPSNEFIGVRAAISRLIAELKNKFSPIPTTPNTEITDRYSDIITCFKRDLRAFKIFADGMGVTLHYAIQPLATWVNKDLSSEEKKLFSILDTMSKDWAVLANYLGEEKERYINDIIDTCFSLGVPCVDLNEMEEFKANSWLFVDRVHLTDEGYKLIAKILKNEFDL